MVQYPTLLLAKLSFYLLYSQIFWPNVKLRWAIYSGGFITTSFFFAASVCQFYYTLPLPGQTVLSKVDLNPDSNTTRVGIATGIFGIISDFYLFFLPIAGVLLLQMSKNRRVGVIAVFATGFSCPAYFPGLQILPLTHLQGLYPEHDWPHLSFTFKGKL